MNHPNVYPASQSWSDAQTLHVACAYSNPLRWESRRRLMNDFRQHMATSKNVRLYVVELAYGDRPFEVTAADSPLDLQLRTSDELFHKENLQNLGVARFPQGWMYGAAIDADMLFTRNDWALEAIHQLQHYAFVQLFSSYSPLSAEHRPTRVLSSFAYNFTNRREEMLAWTSGKLKDIQPSALAGAQLKNLSGSEPPAGGSSILPDSAKWPAAQGATGGAWAFTREAFNAVGGMLDTCILGSADWHMSFGLAGIRLSSRQETELCTGAYAKSITVWTERAQDLRQNIGYVDCHATHGFHGVYANRQYGTRAEILIQEKFDPYVDICRDWQGVLQLTGNKPVLRDKIRAYLRSRREDDPTLHSGEKHIV